MSEQDKSDGQPARPEESSTGDAMSKELEKWKKEAEQAKSQHHSAMAILKQRDEEQRKNENTERHVLIVKISQDSRGFLNKNVLMNLNITNLRRLDNILNRYREQRLDRCLDELKAEDSSGAAIAKGLTVGEYDQKTKEWKK